MIAIIASNTAVHEASNDGFQRRRNVSTRADDDNLQLDETLTRRRLTLKTATTEDSAIFRFEFHEEFTLPYLD